MSEPTYTYVKGEGWVPIPGGLWSVLFRKKSLANRLWHNVIYSNFAESYEKAEARYKDYIKGYQNSDLEFKLVRHETNT